MALSLTSFLSKTLNISEKSITQTVGLLNEGATIPFIARYRKEATNGLDEVQIADIKRQLDYFNALEKRKESILSTIEEQGKLTPELRALIVDCTNDVALEDIYLPYKPKRRTKADIAREKGLESLAKILMKQHESDPEYAAERFVKGEVKTPTEALEGARYIISEWINENVKTRTYLRSQLERGAVIHSKVVKGKESDAHKYRDYFDFNESLKKCAAHRLLAMFRGEDEGFLKVKVKPDSEERLIENTNRFYVRSQNDSANQIILAVKDAYKRLLLPSLETELRNKAKEKADKESIRVFAENLKNLLMEPPLGAKRTLAIDPGFRTGCKLVCLDEQGNFLVNDTIFPHPPQNHADEARSKLKKLVKAHGINAIAIGNGTAGRETEALVQEIDFGSAPEVFLVNEDGASIYSASEAGREEFPNQDITVRGAISIGRRLMDPLAELIKIDPKAMGIGQYQHDVDQKLLKQELDWVVESCVNSVGVNLNTASPHLLTYVSGLGPKLAKNIVTYRKEQGKIGSKSQLKKVAGLGPKAFEQAAGFLRIPDAEQPLDRTAVHPERYALVKTMMKDHSLSITEATGKNDLEKQVTLDRYITDEVGLPTLRDILKELAKPGRDPRAAIQKFEFDPRLKTIDDLREGMIVSGLITNVTNFGAFVNIGIKENGLVHVSNLTNRFVSNPAEVVKLNQQVVAKVIGVDRQRLRVQLSLKDIA